VFYIIYVFEEICLLESTISFLFITRHTREIMKFSYDYTLISYLTVIDNVAEKYF